MANKKNNLNLIDIKYTKLAHEQALINLGSTAMNPSVGCVIVKNNSVISSGRTSFNGRPHAENNALKKKINFKDSDLYVSLEPCSHYGETPPCTNLIIKKKIKRVIFSITDLDPRSKKKAETILKNSKVIVKKHILKSLAKQFYQSYFLQCSNQLPLVDAKLAISKDSYTKNKKERWITNIQSRRLGNFIRSKYDCLLTTSKTINDDNPYLDCRIEGLEKKTPDLIIIDRFLKTKIKLNIFKKKNRKILIFTQSNNKVKENFFKKKGVKIIKVLKNNNINSSFTNIFYSIKKLGYNRILIESGITYLSKLLRFTIIKNLYLFKSSRNLSIKGYKKFNLFLIKYKHFNKNKIKVNLKGDKLYMVKL